MISVFVLNKEEHKSILWRVAGAFENEKGAGLIGVPIRILVGTVGLQHQTTQPPALCILSRVLHDELLQCPLTSRSGQVEKRYRTQLATAGFTPPVAFDARDVYAGQTPCKAFEVGRVQTGPGEVESYRVRLGNK
jgi:hypothetical protein